MDAPTEEKTRKFHISLNVADLNRSVAFYRVLFGTEPAKCRPDYAKFELADPAVVLSLEPMRHQPGGALNHLGLRMPDSATLVGIQERLESAGIPTTREENVECCYARQTKFWCVDPDRNNWELYVVDEDLDHKGNSPRPGHDQTQSSEQASAAKPAPAPANADPVVWEHRLGTPIPARIPLQDASADEIMLRGSFNVDAPADAFALLVIDASRVLRPGGRLVAHGLIADGALDSRPNLPGPAAAVERVPLLGEPLRAFQAAGFIGIHLEKFGASCCLRQGDVGMRELLLVATRPAGSRFDLMQAVVYRGPFRELRDDQGKVFPRGVAVSISGAAAEVLRSGPAADQFAFLTPGDVPVGEEAEAVHA
jgi:catechol 2,3-dioxygenase-like lactoylglutathione lyase family enzyme